MLLRPRPLLADRRKPSPNLVFKPPGSSLTFLYSTTRPAAHPRTSSTPARTTSAPSPAPTTFGGSRTTTTAASPPVSLSLPTLIRALGAIPCTRGPGKSPPLSFHCRHTWGTRVTVFTNAMFLTQLAHQRLQELQLLQGQRPQGVRVIRPRVGQDVHQRLLLHPAVSVLLWSATAGVDGLRRGTSLG